MRLAVHHDVVPAAQHPERSGWAKKPSQGPARSVSEFDLRLLPLLVCPRDRFSLHYENSSLRCERGHRYAVVEGVPILLLADVPQTHVEGRRSLAVAEEGNASSLRLFDVVPGVIDPFVQNAIGATNGSLYSH